MARHLARLRKGLEEALDLDALDRESLQLLQPRSPAINMTAAMQFSMGTREGKASKMQSKNLNIMHLPLVLALVSVCKALLQAFWRNGYWEHPFSMPWVRTP